MADTPVLSTEQVPTPREVVDALNRFRYACKDGSSAMKEGDACLGVEVLFHRLQAALSASEERAQKAERDAESWREQVRRMYDGGYERAQLEIDTLRSELAASEEQVRELEGASREVIAFEDLEYAARQCEVEATVQDRHMGPAFSEAFWYTARAKRLMALRAALRPSGPTPTEEG